jgi:hypothetical protein
MAEINQPIASDPSIRLFTVHHFVSDPRSGDPITLRGTAGGKDSRGGENETLYFSW